MQGLLRTLASVMSVLAAVAAGAFAAPANAADWPTRPVHIVVPYPPGTGPDVMARLITDRLAKDLKQNFVVDNKPGANAIIGTGQVVSAAADGYTFLLVDRLTLSVNPLLYKMPFDPRKDLVSVSNVADVNLYLVVSSQLPVSDFKSFVAYAKANPGKVTFGTGGTGSIMHLNMELLEDGTGAQLLHVPYKALAEVIPAMLAGDVMASSGGVEALQQHVAQGKFKLLAVGAPERTSIMPNVPTIGEVAGQNLLLSTSYSLHAKAGTPPDVLARMHDAVAKVLADPELLESTGKRGLKAYASTPAELDKVIASDAARVGKLVRERNIKVE